MNLRFRLLSGLTVESQGWQVTDPRQNPRSVPCKSRMLSYRPLCCLPMHSQVSLQKKPVNGTRLSDCECGLKFFWGQG